MGRVQEDAVYVQVQMCSVAGKQSLLLEGKPLPLIPRSEDSVP